MAEERKTNVGANAGVSPAQTAASQSQLLAAVAPLGEAAVALVAVPVLPEFDAGVIEERARHLKAAKHVVVGGKKLSVFKNVLSKHDPNPATCAALAAAGQFEDLAAMLQFRQPAPNYLIPYVSSKKSAPHITEAMMLYERAGGDLSYYHSRATEHAPESGSHIGVKHPGGNPAEVGHCSGTVCSAFDPRAVAYVWTRGFMGTPGKDCTFSDKYTHLFMAPSWGNKGKSADNLRRRVYLRVAFHMMGAWEGSKAAIRDGMADIGRPSTSCMGKFCVQFIDNTELFDAIIDADDGDSCAEMLENGAVADYTMWMHQTVVLKAAKAGALQVLQVLAMYGYDVNFSQSCCQLACRPCCVLPPAWALTALLSPYLLYQLCVATGTPLSWAKRHGHHQCAQFLEEFANEGGAQASILARRNFIRTFNKSQNNDIDIDRLVPGNDESK